MSDRPDVGFFRFDAHIPKTVQCDEHGEQQVSLVCIHIAAGTTEPGTAGAGLYDPKEKRVTVALCQDCYEHALDLSPTKEERGLLLTCRLCFERAFRTTIERITAQARAAESRHEAQTNPLWNRRN
jgi:hypothetical protein